MRYITLLNPTSTPEGPPPGELMAAIAKLGEQASKAGVLLDTAGLAPSAAGARIELRGGSIGVSDGPFTEAKELVSYAIYQVSSKEEAVEWASRFLRAHAEHWPGYEGEVQVLKVLGPEDFGPPRLNRCAGSARRIIPSSGRPRHDPPSQCPTAVATLSTPRSRPDHHTPWARPGQSSRDRGGMADRGRAPDRQPRATDRRPGHRGGLRNALVRALEQWPQHGIPPNPAGWLMTTATNRLIDQARRHKTMQRKLPHLHYDQELHQQAADAQRDEQLDDRIGDELLGLIFTACHPVLSIEARVALTLRCLGGLSTEEIGRAFLIAEATAAQRIVRAKNTLRDKHVTFELPSPEQSKERLPDVLQVLYLIFNEGYAAGSGSQWIRPSLCEEAVRLARVLAGLLTDVAEVQGFVALLELQAARIPARTTEQGDPVLILDPDRRLWDRLLIGRGLKAIHHAEQLAAAGSPVGLYMLQAGIAACHARASRPEHTDWKTNPRPVRGAWRAVTQSGRRAQPGRSGDDGPRPRRRTRRAREAGADPRLRDYCYLPAVRAHVLEQAGQHVAARDDWLQAANLTRNERERQLYQNHAHSIGGARHASDQGRNALGRNPQRRRPRRIDLADPR
jgi:predicted RNA polymerase sigma factor